MSDTKLRFVETGGKISKQELRKYAKNRRSQNENRDMKETLLVSHTIRLLTQLFSKSKGAGTRRRVFVYLSYSSEAPTDKLIETLKEEGWEVFCPRVERQEMFPVLLGDDFTLDRHGIREPVGERTFEEMPFVITPLLAVDRLGNRLGYGGGYYDRYFAGAPNAVRIGYCYHFQIVNEVPTEDTDARLHYVVTDKETIEIQR